MQEGSLSDVHCLVMIIVLRMVFVLVMPTVLMVVASLVLNIHFRKVQN